MPMPINATSLETLLAAAVEIADEAQRQVYIDEACGADGALRAELQSMVNDYFSVGRWLDRPAVLLATVDQPSEKIGTQIGPYKLLEQIGEGGMGVVYVAEQMEPVRRRVALKIIKPGMDTRQVVARFEAERQAMAMMDHPNIAKIFDAGTVGQSTKSQASSIKQIRSTKSKAPNESGSPVPDIGPSNLEIVCDLELGHCDLTAGRPYFVMELVRGLPITEYCDKARLSPRQRLALFADVCSAVQHAHQKGVIHRDLKPSNVMVTTNDGRPVVKVIDFGVAKAVGQQLTERTVYTALTQLVGTPLYMSPEQAELTSHDVDTRSDVYSLGVLLYELLTGQTPFDKERLKNVNFDEMRRIIREEEPETVSARIAKTRKTGTRGSGFGTSGSDTEGLPSTPSPEPRAPRLSELDWIVMKALEKDRSRRYESASALAADIQRYLSDEPVLACPPTTMYRFQKFARKHKPALVTAAAIALCLILGTTVSAWQAVRATTAEAQAEANEQKANAERDEVKALADKLAAKEQQLQKTLYAAHINLAHNALDAGAPARLRELLDQHRQKPGELDLRNFEWHYLNRLCPTDLFVLRGQTGQLNRLAYSPDGKRLATVSVSSDHVKVWDAETGKEFHSLQADGPVSSLAFSPDGKRIASGTAQSTVKVWDAETGQELRPIQLSPGRDLILRIAFSSTGKHLAAGTGSGRIKVIDAQSFAELRTIEAQTSAVEAVAFSPDGKRLASGGAGHGTVKLWDVEAGQELLTLNTRAYGVAFSPDGGRLVTVAPGTLKLWDAQTGKELRTLQPHQGPSATFSPDGKCVASGGADGSVTVWDAETGERLFKLPGHAASVGGVAYSPDGKRLVSASLDNTVRMREAKPIPKARTIGTKGYVNVLLFSSNGKRLVGLSGQRDQEITVWDAQTGESLNSISTTTSNGPFQSVSFSADGRRAAAPIEVRRGAGTAEANVWDLETGKPVIKIPFKDRNATYRLVLSADGNRLAAAKRISSGASVLDQRNTAGEIVIYDVQTGAELRTIPSAAAPAAFTPDGQFLAGTAGDKSVKLWDLKTGAEIASIQGPRTRLAFSPDGRRLAGLSEADTGANHTVVKLWDARTGEELLALRGHSGIINGLAFSPDGQRLATTARDGTLKVWDLETGQELLTLAGRTTAANCVAFSPDGNWLAGGGPGGINIYDATPLPEKP